MKPLKIKLVLFALMCSIFSSCSNEEDGIYFDEINEADQVNHDGFTQRQENLVSKANAKSVGENVAYGFNSSKVAVMAWLNSEEHRAIIENQI